MTVRRTWAAAILGICVLAVVPAALAQEQSKLVIGGTTYTKWLWGNQRNQGSLYNFTTVPGEGYGDNGQGSEVELLLSARLSRKVEVRARIHSRFSQNFWTNFGGFGGINPATQDPPPSSCTDGDCGEFDPRSNQYVKLRGVAVTLTPGYKWIDSATIGANDFGQFDPFVLGRIRYIDRDNGAGLLFQGSALDRKITWDFARVSLPRLWAGPNFSTGDFHAADASYDLQGKWEISPAFDLGLIAQYVNDMEVDSDDNIFDDGRDVRTRFRNSVGGIKIGVRPGSKIDLSGRYYSSTSDSQPIAGAPSGFGPTAGFGPVLAGPTDDDAWRLNADFNDPFGFGLSFNLEVFDIGAQYVSMMAARRESDVLLTEGHDGAFAFPGPTNAAFGVFGGNPTRIGPGGWDGNAAQVATINVDNEFTDFDEQMAETVIGWKGATLVPAWSSGSNDISAEVTWVDYNTNWQAFDLNRLTDVPYPTMENDSGVGHNFRSAYAPFQDKETLIALLKGKHVLNFGKGMDLFWKVKHIDETDDRLTDAAFLGLAQSTIYCQNCPDPTPPATFGDANLNGLLDPGEQTGNQYGLFDAVTDDDRDLDYWLYSLGVGYQLHDDLYGSVQYERYDVDLLDGNTAFQGYNLHEMVTGDHKKNRATVRARYVLGGAEMGLSFEHIWGTFTPDLEDLGAGTDFVIQFADAGTATGNNVPLGSPGFRGRFGGWNSLAERDYRQNRLKAFLKVQF